MLRWPLVLGGGTGDWVGTGYQGYNPPSRHALSLARRPRTATSLTSTARQFHRGQGTRPLREHHVPVPGPRQSAGARLNLALAATYRTTPDSLHWPGWPVFFFSLAPVASGCIAGAGAVLAVVLASILRRWPCLPEICSLPPRPVPVPDLNSLSPPPRNPALCSRRLVGPFFLDEYLLERIFSPQRSLSTLTSRSRPFVVPKYTTRRTTHTTHARAAATCLPLSLLARVDPSRV